MLQIIPKAKIHWIERWGVTGGYVLSALGVGGMAAQMTGPAAPVAAAGLAAGVAAALASALWPGLRFGYRVEIDRLIAGRLEIPYAAITSVRQVTLAGTLLYGAPALPGYWSGRAWSAKLGKFWLEGSTGLGPAVLVTLADGRAIAVTPADPSGTAELLDTLRRTVAPPPEREEAASPGRKGDVIPLPIRRSTP